MGDKPKKNKLLTPEAVENLLISLASKLAEKQLRDGTASSQVMTHFLKLGTTREKLEKEIMEETKIHLQAKTDSLKSAAKVEELFAEAISAMRRYSGGGKED